MQPYATHTLPAAGFTARLAPRQPSQVPDSILPCLSTIIIPSLFIIPSF